MNESLKLLKKYWGFESFRSLQSDIIDSVIYGKDTLAILPTGGGKSICFQIPGIAREGVCLVISPLIALMHDQVEQLEKKGIRAKAITSMMSYREIDISLDNAKFGGLDFLYTSPERVQSKLFIERFKQMNVSLIVVDEAHCISEWGHDFRPYYKKISLLRQYHPEVPIIALTATATKEVKQDIIKQLELKNPSVFEGDFHRENLSYEVCPVENKEDALFKWIEKFPDFCGVIYCQTRKSVKELANYLLLRGVNSGIYHGGLDAKTRDLMMSNWIENKTPIMIATNAFGMGIDKPDVRYVIHYEFPSNIEAYFQEAGRAGRDGKESRTLVLFQQKDIEKQQKLVDQQFPPIEIVKSTYRALCNYLHLAIGSGEGETFPIQLNEFCNSFRLELIPTFQSLKILEMNGDLLFTESIFTPTRLKFAVGNTTLYSFQIKHDRTLKLISLLSRNYPGIFEYYFNVDEEFLASKLGVSVTELVKQFQFLEENGIIDISWKTDLPKVTFLHERLPDDYMRLSDEVYYDRKYRAYDRWQEMVNYLTRSHCREKFLIEYFGQKAKLCGKCDYCKGLKKEMLTLHKLQNLILSELKITPKSFDLLLNIIGDAYKVDVKKALQMLVVEEVITYNDGLYFIK